MYPLNSSPTTIPWYTHIYIQAHTHMWTQACIHMHTHTQCTHECIFFTLLLASCFLQCFSLCFHFWSILAGPFVLWFDFCHFFPHLFSSRAQSTFSTPISVLCISFTLCFLALFCVCESTRGSQRAQFIPSVVQALGTGLRSSVSAARAPRWLCFFS